MGHRLNITGGHFITMAGRSLGVFLSVAVLMGLPASVSAQTCRVLDQELQGHFSGECRDGLAEGKGEAAGIAAYRGTFRAGMKHGSGIKTWPWGDRYQGEFANDAMEGEGDYAWSSTGRWAGEEYRGHFIANRREGAGQYRWPTGEQLSGPWQADLPAGAVDPRLYDRLIAHARADIEAQIAVGKVGIRVCRPVKFGISEQEWIKGVVVAVRKSAVSIEIEIPGRHPRTLNGVDLKKGATFWDVAQNWNPCL